MQLGRAVPILIAALAVALLLILILPAGRERPAPEVTITCVGDIMLGREVAQVCAERGAMYPFEEVAEELSRGDLTFGNLECPLTDHGTRIPRVNSMRADPAMAQVLAQVSFDVLSLANNHAIDWGRPGLEQSLEVLAGAGITPVGAGRTLKQARACRVLKAGGLRVGFVALSNFPEADFVHAPDRPSLAILSEESLDEIVPAAAGSADVVVVSLHWGQEGVRAPSDFERATARRAIDLGADLVVGHHAHVRGEIERYRHGLIAYCLGNLVFDEDSYGGNEGWILHVTAGADGVRDCRAVPVRVDACRAVIEWPQ